MAVTRKKTKGKYNNKKAFCDGFTFDSQAELRFYHLLNRLKVNGTIKDFRMQIPFLIMDGYIHKGKRVQKMEYIADFILIFPDDSEVVIDIKSKVTDNQLFRNKIKMLLQRYPDTDFWIVKEPQHHNFTVTPLYGSRKDFENIFQMTVEI